jgi:aspartate-semialdehyde dehydrogenase
MADQTSMEKSVSERIPVGILGTTGTVGARLVAMLANHPWFEIAEVGASDRSAGGRLGDLLAGEAGALPPSVADLEVRSLAGEWSSPLLLSALPSSIAREVEPRLAGAGHLVVSNASTFRQDPDVPLIIPEINADHLALIDRQKSRWPGAIITNPNCVVTGLATAIAPLHEAFGLERAVATTFQAISGAGKPGPPAFDLVDNVIPFIPGEEEKVAYEPRKILGSVAGGALEEAPFRVGVTATRVNVLHGHLVSVSAQFRDQPGPDAAIEALRAFRGQVADLGLPSSPERLIEVTDDPMRPQPRLDRDLGRGMTVTVGRVRSCDALGLSFLALAHNLDRGAAGAAMLNAELCRVKGLVDAAVGTRT